MFLFENIYNKKDTKFKEQSVVVELSGQSWTTFLEQYKWFNLANVVELFLAINKILSQVTFHVKMLDT